MGDDGSLGRSIETGLLAGAGSWAALTLGIGYEGASRAVSVGLDTLAADHWVALVLAGLTAATFAAVGCRRGARPLQVLSVVVAMDLFAAIVLAPLLVGELSPTDPGPVIATLSALGLQPLGALIGASVVRAGGRAQRKRACTASDLL